VLQKEEQENFTHEMGFEHSLLVLCTSLFIDIFWPQMSREMITLQYCFGIRSCDVVECKHRCYLRTCTIMHDAALSPNCRISSYHHFTIHIFLLYPLVPLHRACKQVVQQVWSFSFLLPYLPRSLTSGHL
jgi:hypothetical protein